MYKLNIKNERIITDWQFFLFKEFRDIWDSDSSLERNTAHKLLNYVFLLADLSDDNPLANDKNKDRMTEAKFRAFHDRSKKLTNKQESMVEAAVALYIDLNVSSDERLLHSFDNMASRLSSLLARTKPETVVNVDSGVVSYASNSKIIASALSKLSKLRGNRDKIIAIIKKESMTQKIRGQLTLSPLIRGLIHMDFVADRELED